jgi:hypothetical protein
VAWPIVTVTSGGIPVTEATNGFGTPVEEAANGFGTAVTFVESGGLPVLGGVGTTLLAAPTLSWTSGTTDNTPDLTVTFPDILVTGTDVTFEYANNSGFTGATSVVHDLTSPEALAQAMNLALSALTDGTWYIRVKYDGSAWSNTETKTIDAAPTLTSPTGVKTGQTTATVGATTDHANGTLYWVVTTSATPPSAAQVKAGQNDGGTSAAASGSQSISSTGVKTANATGLLSATTYYAHSMHEDSTAHQSNVVDSSSFLTDSGVVKTYRDAQTSGAASDTQATFTVDIGTASADRLVVIASAHQKGDTLTSVKVNGVTLTRDADGFSGTTRACIFSGLVTSGSGSVTVEVNNSSGATFTSRSVVVWTLTGLSSNLVKQTVASATNVSSVSIDVTAGDFLFASKYFSGGTPTYSGSTQAVDALRSIGVQRAGEWLVASTNAAFSVVPGGNNTATSAVTYR